MPSILIAFGCAGEFTLFFMNEILFPHGKFRFSADHPFLPDFVGQAFGIQEFIVAEDAAAAEIQFPSWGYTT